MSAKSVPDVKSSALCSFKAVGAFSRTSIGVDLVAAMLGSEGCLGIITSVVVKVVPLPEISEHASFLFKDFQVMISAGSCSDRRFMQATLNTKVVAKHTMAAFPPPVGDCSIVSSP